MKAKKHSFWLNCYVAVLLALILIMPSFIFNFNISPTQAAISLEGTGTSSNPYKISTTADLTTFANWVNNGNTGENQYFELTNNISGAGVPVIGNSGATKFAGNFNGNGFSIRNLNRANNSTQLEDLGLFGFLQGTVRNLIILNGTITLSVNGKSAGAIAGSTYAGAIIERCFNVDCTVQVTNSNLNTAQTGGIVGTIAQNTSISYCGNSANISNQARIARAGGIIGIQNEGIASIMQCYNTGNITAGTSISNESFAGGITGQNGRVLNCYNTGNITSNALQSTSTQTIPHSVSNKTSSQVFIEQYTENYTNVITTEYAYAGGISGYTASNITNCFNVGNVSGGKVRYKIYNEAYYETQKYNSLSIFSTISTEVEFDVLLYKSDINGNINTSSTNCYGIFTYVENNLNYKVHENQAQYYAKDTNSERVQVTYYDGDLLNKTNQPYSSVRHSTYGPIIWYDTTIDLSVYNLTINNGQISFGLTAEAEIISGRNTILQTMNLNCYSSNLNFTNNYTIRSKSNMQSQSFANTLGSSIWGYNSLINNGLPYLKNLFWTNSAAGFEN